MKPAKSSSHVPSETLVSSRAVSVARMQQIDQTAIDTLGIPRLLLMEHAGLAVARAVESLIRPQAEALQGPILVCCGTGFNGGDGLAAARHLEGLGYPLQLIVAGRVDRLSEEPAVYANVLRRLGVPVFELDSAEALPHTARWVAACRLMVDALLGIGVRGPVRQPMHRLIDLMNRAGKPIVAADIPSGLDADTGMVQGTAVRASLTVAFGLPKQGCFLNEGPVHVGRLVVDPITIPRRLLDPRP